MYLIKIIILFSTTETYITIIMIISQWSC